VRFLEAVSGTWNITLFHYRNTGNRESSVLMGVQVCPMLLRVPFAFVNRWACRCGTARASVHVSMLVCAALSHAAARPIRLCALMSLQLHDTL